MLINKHQEPKEFEEKKQHLPEGTGNILSEEIFSSLQDYALKGAEDEYSPHKAKENPDLIVDI